ncbi:tripartite-type tricarboxylate transporter receptor subunit TctC [Bradyrhizobium sp. R2.2-H]|jgi:tripartite-type tricarboxylate transporter receptor subunit TctC|uniref:tripartite tricarboxylate transporter substrate-binding protein n=1 Tax=unclassified Bradyrhizobium TaxID=2631580 RepID=UPI001045390C|nr:MULTISPECIES: tripartite tricarboxylate transporter substrate-binding protein [unclassified Bradyrhizobium]TCU69309.1 tripartite-type tricarboxylate transporter receptor subunit TctC [Bradyrhizobium sp. Y-H1]TCU70801.1 tripartite-type tricarboxylate transporter receptor subunit TctC [Bradyrhizobium sp. R2.2-H]
MPYLVRSLILLFLLSPSGTAIADEYPSRPVTIIVPFSAGGPGDVIARILGSAMSAALKQSIVIENAVGAGGTLGTNRVAKAAPDGYTLLLMHVGQATAPALYAKLPFDPVGDFAPIGLVTDVPMILVARPSFPAKDLSEMIARIRGEGGKMTFGNVGLGSASQLCGLMFMSATDTKLTPIYYKGGGPALNDVIAGHIDVYCDPATGPTPYIQSKTIRGYAITSKTRVATLPDVPTSAEAGVPEFNVTTWYGLYAPRGTPKPVLDRLVGALQSALRDPVLVNRFAELSRAPVEPERATPDALEGFLKAEIGKWGMIIKAAGIDPQ